MKNLFLDPTTYDIKLIVDTIEKGQGYVKVRFVFGQTVGNFCFTQDNSKRVGEWFLKLSKTIADRNS